VPQDARKPREQQVFSITSAAESQSEDRLRREKRYALSMGIRTVCFLGGVVLVMQPMPWRVMGWIMFAAAIFLPYIAVGRQRRGAQEGLRPVPVRSRARQADRGAPQPPARRCLTR
jgi:hypothetical protein